MISKPLLHAFDMSALWRQWPKDLDSQRHLILQVYYLLVSLTIGGFCFVHGPMDYLNPNLMALTCVAGLYLLYTFKRLSQRMATHGLLLTSMVLIFYITLNAGGLASPQILWLGMIPVAAIFLLGMKDAQFWSGAVLLSIVSLFVLTFVGWLPAVFWYDRSLITWAGITSLCITSNVFFLPLLYHLLNNKQLKDIEHRNSELENTRIALLQSESHKDKFMAAVGHELRTPMNAILGFNDVLREEVQLQADDLETVQLINQSTLKLLNLINQILDFSQLQAGRMQLFAAPTFLPGLMQHVCDAKQHSEVAKVPIRLQLGATVPEWVQVDAQRLKEVLLHLLDNACKFTSEGHIELRVRVQDTHLLFEVSDTGTGIPLALQNHIFKRFEHADQETVRQFGGSGLGLAISKQLIALFGGDMGLESQVGQGSRFWFRIPMLICEPPASSPAMPVPPWDQAFTLLLVDDNPVNLQVARHVCQNIWPQAHLLTAPSGADCLSVLQANPVDLVLMDMFMPELDGPHTCKTIRQHLHDPISRVPIIGLTASTHPHDKQLCLAAGMNDVIYKPLDKAVLAHAVQQQLKNVMGQGALP